jgi:hypothetical protein
MNIKHIIIWAIFACIIVGAATLLVIGGINDDTRMIIGGIILTMCASGLAVARIFSRK